MLVSVLVRALWPVHDGVLLVQLYIGGGRRQTSRQ